MPNTGTPAIRTCRGFDLEQYSIRKEAAQEPIAYSLNGLTRSKIVGSFERTATAVLEYDPVHDSFIVKNAAAGNYSLAIQSRSFNYGGGSTENMQLALARVPAVIETATVATADLELLVNSVDNFPTDSLDSAFTSDVLLEAGDILQLFGGKGGNQPSNIRRIRDITVFLVPTEASI